jgi:CRISPR/Cas system CMR-associated protein Cmr1 (group 7 of RAMP superfamily)
MPSRRSSNIFVGIMNMRGREHVQVVVLYNATALYLMKRSQ